MARLNEGSAAPGFTVADHLGNPVSLEGFRGRKLLLSFYRYAACPLCNLRIHELIARHRDLAGAGLSIVAVFQSPVETIRKYVGRQDAPFPIVPDPGLALYRQYGVEKGWKALFGVMRLRKQDFTKAAQAGFSPGRINGPVNRIPADFLIDGDGILRRCYYGADIGDHIPLEQVDSFLRPSD